MKENKAAHNMDYELCLRSSELATAYSPVVLANLKNNQSVEKMKKTILPC